MASTAMTTKSVPLVSQAYPFDQPPTLNFHRVNQSSPYMPQLRDIFEKIIKPLYGPQEDALNKIGQAKDRACYMLYEGNRPVGVIVFKTELSNEFASSNIHDSIEIKSLFVVDSTSNSGRGLGTTLLNKIIEEGEKLKINHAGFHVTVSETKQESLTFFQRKGFRIADEWRGKYKDATTEYLLARPAQLPEVQPSTATKVMELLAQDMGRLPIQDQRSFEPKVLLRVKNAHWDDIHSLRMLSDGTFISGSKDNSLYKWNLNGECVRAVCEVEPQGASDKDWITAVEVLNDEYWMSGERNGRVSLWTTSGDFVRDILQKRPKFGHISKKENAHRVHCLAAGVNKQKLSFFTGFPTIFDEYNLIENKTVCSTQVHVNDWIYCIHPLTESKNLIVTGGVLEVWKKNNRQWQRESVLMPEGPKIQSPKGRRQRPFISSLTQLQSSPAHFGLAVFGGSVKVIDIEQAKIVKEWKEHKERVWNIENISREVFASSCEDKTIKFWDLRSQGSVFTINTAPGQVHAMLSPSENLLIAGSSQENAWRRNEGAELVFYDLRK